MWRAESEVRREDGSEHVVAACDIVFTDPITESNDLKGAGDRAEAPKLLMELCQADRRCLDAHPHLGFAFDDNPRESHPRLRGGLAHRRAISRREL